MKNNINQLKATIKKIFDYLHQNPEPSWQEYETTVYLKTLLESYGFTVQTFDDCTGLVVEVGEGNICVGVRADIDALWQNVDGIFRANHSCGHDAHMTMVIGTMLLLKEMNAWPKNGKLKFIFQPAEEKGTGALKLIEKGVVDNLDFLYGVHLRPLEELKFGEASPATFHGSATFMTGIIRGVDAHGARPHLGQNAIEVGATLVNELNRIHINPMVPASVKITSFHAGSETGNLIPGEATFSLDLRAQTNEVMIELTNRVIHLAEIIATLYQVEISLTTTGYVAAATVDETAKSFMEQAIIETLGQENNKAPIITPGGEDFHFYTLKRPNIKATMLGLGCDLQPGLHHPKMSFNREAMYNGIEIITRAVLYTFEKANCLEGEQNEN
ncbi:MAG TPA: amidohydrolase [Bacillus bacterium]|nr:amidohydrolase [Bacillus sp. (in: firmicutes)]